MPVEPDLFVPKGAHIEFNLGEVFISYVQPSPSDS